MRIVREPSLLDDLAAGRGRAWVRVRRSRGRGLEQEIDRACLRAIAFDPQLESGERGEWLHGVARMAGRTETLRPEMIRALDGDEPWTRLQAFRWLCEEARGSGEAREAVRSHLARDPELLGSVPREIFREVAYSGFEASLRNFAAQRDPGASRDVRWLLSSAADALGASGVSDWSRRAADADPAVGVVLALADRPTPPACGEVESTEPTRPLPRAPGNIDIDAILDGREPMSATKVTRWASTAPAEDLARLEARLSTEGEPRALERLLHAFFERRMTSGVERVLELAGDGDRKLAVAALRALGPMDDDARARTIVLARLEQGDRDEAAACIRALANGRAVEAIPAILGRLRRGLPKGLDHAAVSGVLELATKRPLDDLTEVLEWAWDYFACSFCRGDVYRELHRRGPVRPRIRREALHDSHPELRTLAAESDGSTRPNGTRSKA